MYCRMHHCLSQVLKLGVLSFSMALAACGGSTSDSDLSLTESSGIESAASIRRTTPTTLFKGNTSAPWPGVVSNNNLIIDNASDWSILWAEIQKANASDSPLPVIDFRTQVVVGITRVLPDGCSDASIRQIDYQAQKVTIEVQIMSAEAEFFCTQQMKHGLHLVRTNKPKAPMIFVEVKT